MSKKYGVIIADPPWQYSNSGRHSSAAQKYDTMPLEAIESLPVGELAAPDSVLLLWATWPLLPAAMQVIPAWGFEYVTGFPWIKIVGAPQPNLWDDYVYKPMYGMGYWVRGCSELLLICRRGQVDRPTMNFTGIISKNFQHSRKPDNLYQLAESLPGPYLEMFARRQRVGWSVFGNEVESSVALECPE